jgi:hypothetical protein
LLDLLPKIQGFFMLTTRYSPGNLVLLLLGILIAFGSGWASVMTMAFGADPIHDLRSGVIMAVLWFGLLLVPASAITARWPRLGAIIFLSVVGLCCVSVWASSAVLLVLVPAAIEGLIATTIAASSVPK